MEHIVEPAVKEPQLSNEQLDRFNENGLLVTTDPQLSNEQLDRLDENEFLVITDPQLSNEQLDRFAENGFLVITDFVPPADIKACREKLLRLFEDRAGYDRGALYDLVSPQGEPDRIPQLMFPSNFDRSLREAEVHKAALAVACRVLGPEARPSFEYAILKRSKGGPTPWHQDEAFKEGVRVGQREIAIWIPMQPATEQNGCLRYIPGSHKGDLLSHASSGGDVTAHALQCTPDDAVRAVYAPVPLGGCVFHDMRTIHGGGPNMTDGERLAYILLFDTPTKGPAAKTFSWLKEKKDPAHERRSAWLRRGGWIIESLRMIRQGELNWPRVRNALSRTIARLRR